LTDRPDATGSFSHDKQPFCDAKAAGFSRF
jgi:hypothetical protein